MTPFEQLLASLGTADQNDRAIARAQAAGPYDAALAATPEQLGAQAGFRVARPVPVLPALPRRPATPTGLEAMSGLMAPVAGVMQSLIDPATAGLERMVAGR